LGGARLSLAPSTNTRTSIGAPDWGGFSTSLSFTSPGSGDGFLEVYWVSPKDGSDMDTIRIPVNF
jgi:hypothetical protein